MADEKRELLLSIKADIKDAQRRLKELEAGSRKVSLSFESLDKVVRGAGLAIAGATAAVGAASVALSRLGRAAQEGQRIELVTRQFGNLAAAAGTTATAQLERLREATRGTIDDFTLLQKSAEAAALGIDFTEYDELTENIRRISSSIGLDFNRALESATVAIGRESRLLLDNLGIILQADSAYQDLATTLGKTTKELTFAEKAIFEITQRGEALEDPILSAGEAATQAEVAFSNLTSRIQVGLNQSPQLQKAFTAIAESINEIDVNKIVDLFNKIAELGPGIIGIFEGIAESINRVLDLVDTRSISETRQRALLRETAGRAGSLDSEEILTSLQTLNSVNVGVQQQITELQARLSGNVGFAERAGIESQIEDLQQALEDNSFIAREYTKALFDNTEVVKDVGGSGGLGGSGGSGGASTRRNQLPTATIEFLELLNRAEAGGINTSSLLGGFQFPSQAEIQRQELFRFIEQAFALPQGLTIEQRERQLRNQQDLEEDERVQRALENLSLEIGSILLGELGIGNESGIGGQIGSAGGSALAEAIGAPELAPLFESIGNELGGLVDNLFGSNINASEAGRRRTTDILQGRLGESFGGVGIGEFGGSGGFSQFAIPFGAGVGGGLNPEDFQDAAAQVAALVDSFITGTDEITQFNQGLVATQVLLDQTGLNIDEAKEGIATAFAEGKLSLEEFGQGLTSLNLAAQDNLKGEGNVIDAILGIGNTIEDSPLQALKFLELLFVEAGEVGIDSAQGIIDAYGEDLPTGFADALKALSEQGIQTLEDVRRIGTDTPDLFFAFADSFTPVRSAIEETFGAFNARSDETVTNIQQLKQEVAVLRGEFERLGREAGRANIAIRNASTATPPQEQGLFGASQGNP